MPPSKTQGKNWLLLRGLARGSGHWASFSDLIQKQFPHDRFEYIDLPGNGVRNHLTSPLSVASYVKDLRQQCPYLKEKVPFQVLALSLGAMITVEWMKSYPHEIEKAFLVCTSSSRYSKFYERFQPQNLLKGAPLLTAQKNPILWEQTILSLISNNVERRNAELATLVEYSEKHPVRADNVLRQMWAASRYRFPKQAPGEIILIGSYGDQLVAPECTLNIGKQWGIEPIMHATSGHDIPIDDPRWLIEHLL